MMRDLVSIVMPSYNTAEHIKESIESVLAQTYENWELIIVDDASTDGTDEVVRGYLADKRITYIPLSQNGGAAVARNRALREAKGRWIAFLDSDDCWRSEKLERQLAFMQKNGYAFSYTAYSEMDEESRPLGVRVRGPRKITRRGMYRYCWPGCLTVMYDATAVGLIQVADIQKNNDYAMWLQVSQKADCHFLNEELASYRIRRGSISRRGYTTLIRWHYKLFREAEGRSPLVAGAMTVRNLFFGAYKKLRYVKRRQKACVCGHFAFGQDLLNGQTVKTKVITEELERVFGKEDVGKVDTHGGKKTLLTLPFRLFSALKRSENVLIFPAQNGLRVIAPLLTLQNRLFHRRLHYVVIGGWLPEFLREHTGLTKTLQRFAGIYVETGGMKAALEAAGFANVILLPNCKPLSILQAEELPRLTSEPYRLCTFSRVMKEKGIEEAVKAVQQVNEEAGRPVFTLDIYGQVEPGQEEWFEALQAAFPAYVTYGGSVPYEESVTVLKDCFALLFPTKFYTEGIPGTVIDAYAAGVPVIASRWENAGDIVFPDVAIDYPFGDKEALPHILRDIAAQPDRILQKKPACLTRAKAFLPKTVIRVLIAQLG